VGRSRGWLDVFHVLVEYVERGNEYGILFIVSLFCEYVHVEYIRIHVIYEVNQAEYVIHIRVVAPQEYVNIYSTLRIVQDLVHMGGGGWGKGHGFAP